MKRIIQLLILLFAFPSLLTAQKKEVLITIEDNEVSKAEFERIYRKNNQNLMEESDIKSPEKYLELYIGFKLKVVEAENLKMDTVKIFRDELAGYRKELAAPYLTDMQYDESLVKELYQRMAREVNASHILFRINENSGAEQEQAVFEKAKMVREEILKGKQFSAAAMEYSEDPSAQNNMGSLGYFSAFQMVTPFENVAFKTPVGEISQPVRTSFGYHLIQVHDIRENQGEIKVAHIMKMFPREEDLFDKSQIKAEIDSIYRALLNGADFAEMARLHSDDKQSGVQGGEMPWFSAGRMIPEFSEPAFKLKNTGDISEPVETPFGYHIIKKTGTRPIASFEQVRADIENRIKQDPERSNSTKKVFIEKLKKEYHFSENHKNYLKTEILDIDAETEGNLLLFTIDNKNFFLEDFKNYLHKENITKGIFSDHYEAWTDAEIISMEDARLEDKYPEFRYLMQEYHDGLLLFNIMEEKIWKFAAEDSTGLEEYYNNNKEQFLWEERFKGMVITCSNPKTREDAEKYFEAGMTPEEVEDLLNQHEKMVEIKTGSWEKGEHPAVDYYIWNSPAPEELNSELTFVRGNKIPPEPKTLEEARGFYISEYQNFLEKNWLKALRKKYKVKVNKKLLKSIPDV